MAICPFAFSFVVNPFSFIYVTIRMNKFALTVRLIVSPLTFIPRTIWPQLVTEPIPHTIEPLSSVHCPIFQCEWTFSNSSVLISLFIIFIFIGFLNCFQILLLLISYINKRLVVLPNLCSKSSFSCRSF